MEAKSVDHIKDIVNNCEKEKIKRIVLNNNTISVMHNFENQKKYIIDCLKSYKSACEMKSVILFY